MVTVTGDRERGALQEAGQGGPLSGNLEAQKKWTVEGLEGQQSLGMKWPSIHCLTSKGPTSQDCPEAKHQSGEVSLPRLPLPWSQPTTQSHLSEGTWLTPACPHASPA